MLQKRFIFILVLVVTYLLLFYILYKYKNAYKMLFGSAISPLVLLFAIWVFYSLNKKLGIFVAISLSFLFLVSKTIKEPFAWRHVSMMDPNVDDNLSYTGPESGEENSFGDGSGSLTYYGSGTVHGYGPGSGVWDTKVITAFLEFQQIHNPNILFDMNLIQQQASQDEAEKLLETGMWPWSKRVKEIYNDAIYRSVISKKGALKSMNQDRTVYNQTAIMQMISWNTKEGKFLLNGTFVENPTDTTTEQGTYGVTSGLVNNNKDLIRCAGSKLQRVHNLGNDGITGVHTKKVIAQDYNELPSLISGFSFLREPCNPCNALQYPPDYSCPFSLNSDKKVSPVWESLWGLGTSKIQKMPAGFPYWMN